MFKKPVPGKGGRIKGSPIPPLNIPDYPYGPGGPKPCDGHDTPKPPPLNIPDYPYGPGGPKI
ncbi:MAG: hypothetical protein K6B72_00270 [Lachnospiraceae bacterium]|nr:hypothetical protein [Lachnospiraceae bacterium]